MKKALVFLATMVGLFTLSSKVLGEDYKGATQGEISLVGQIGPEDTEKKDSPKGGEWIKQTVTLLNTGDTKNYGKSFPKTGQQNPLSLMFVGGASLTLGLLSIWLIKRKES